ncbi:MAG: DUF1194 domain-containing protein [Alphaproteobacteria bacterium]|nr:DUF1194 domain-containing protein [Alphaproteobacteria bacterium]
MPILRKSLPALARLWCIACIPLLALLAGSPAQAQKTAVDIELVLAIDVSGSVDPFEARMQRDGYYAALTSPKVIRAIESGVLGRIGVIYMEWAGAHYQRTVIDWTLINNADSARQFIARLADVPPTSQRWTSISGAMDYAMTLFAQSPFEGTRRVIDISGDGSNNNGRPIREAREDVLKAGVIVNGLPIINDRPTMWGGAPEVFLDKYYEENVIGGPGSFMIVADGFEKFADAILTKLIMEIAGTPPGGPTRYAARRADE